MHQEKDYQSVVAPFDGVITQRNIDVGSLVQADASSGTFMFTIMQSDVIRTQVYVPQGRRRSASHPVLTPWCGFLRFPIRSLPAR